MRIILEDVPDELGREFLKWLAERGGRDLSVTVESEWTADRAAQLLAELRPEKTRARALLRAAVDGDGWVSGDAFRAQHGERALKGPTRAITTAIRRGAEAGWWPPDITKPLIPTAPGKEGWRPTTGYHMPTEALPAFRAAFHRIEGTTPAKNLEA